MIRHLALVTLLVIAELALSGARLKKEEIVNRCLKANREELEPCLLKLISEIQPEYENGLPEFDVPPVGKVVVEHFSTEQYDNENSYLRAQFFNLTVKGLQDLQVTKLKMDYPKHTATYEAFIPEYYLAGRYTMDAMFAVVPVKGEGTFWSRLENIVVKGVSEFTVDKDYDGVYRMLPVDTDANFDYETIRIRLNNLFANNPVLQQGAETFLNENARNLIDTVKPTLVRRVIDLAHDAARNVSRHLDLTEFAGYEFLKQTFEFPEQ